jgi:hypothetical protein
MEIENSVDRPIVTLHTFAFAAIAATLDQALLVNPTSPELQNLCRYQAIATADQPHWVDALKTYLRQPVARDHSLLRLSKSLSLTIIEVLSISLAIAVEQDTIAGRILAYLQAPLGGSRPTLGLLSSAFSPLSQSVSIIDRLMIGNAIASGLLQLLNESASLPEQSIKVPLHIGLALRGHDRPLPDMTIGLDDYAVPLAASMLTEAQRWATSLQSGTQRVLVLRTRSQVEGKSVACAIAASLQRRPLFIATDQTANLAPWLLLRHLLPIFCYDLAPGDRKILPSLPFYQGPVLAVCGIDGNVEAPAETVLNWVVPVPNVEERQQLWHLAIADETLSAELAQQHRHSSGRIAQLGRLAQHHQILQHHDQPTREHVIAAAWTSEGVGLDALAQPLTDAIPDDALVMTPALRDELQMLFLRCRHRDRLVTGLGLSATVRYCPGVRSLFVGASGTGKTLAAGWLATKLGMPLYRVDLASITSKYIGETEKNLSQLLSRAEQAEVVLLFDEADSLFGKRTDVQQANDRFANAQTNYLLQRIESFDGITLLTSNSRSRFDSAFSRRLDMIIEFPLPQAEERRSLWHSHLGNGHQLTQSQLNQLAATVDLSGGNIRNAVLAAAVIAQSQTRAITFADVVQGVASEYRKLGRQLPAELIGDRASIL